MLDRQLVFLFVLAIPIASIAWTVTHEEIVAVAQSRAVVIDGRGFGRMAIQADAPFVGNIYIRPGHASSIFMLDVIDTVRASALDLEAPFLIVAERREAVVRVRFRTQPPS